MVSSAAATVYANQLRPASFRGVPFQVNGTDFGAGRRVQVHEYPQRDMPWVEDLGRATREISFDGFLIGANYIDQANQLLAALETSGPGALVHPWLGAMQVCLSAPARVRFDSGLGMATISMSFVEAGELSFPAPTSSTQVVSRLTADGLASAAITDFSNTFTVNGFQSFVSSAAQGHLASMLGFLGAGQLAQVLGTATTVANLVTQAASFVNNPQMLGQTLLSAFGLSGAAGAVAAWSNVVKLITSAAGASAMSGTVAASALTPTPSRSQINANTAALYGLGRQLLLAQAVGISSLVGTDQDNLQAGIAALTQQDQGTSGQSVVLTTGVIVQTIAGITQPQSVAQQVTQDMMLAVRDALLAALDAESLRCGDACYDALQEAYASVYADLTGRAQSAARLTTWTPPETMPMLAVAYELYADATRDAEIIFRNGIRNPGMTPPFALSVLTA
jgi:prophage DNA circulation protein